jgi:type VI secretion system secreted protein Hcp
MAVDIFLKLDPVKGESADSKHKDWIDVLSFSWGMTQSGNTHVATGGGSGKVNVQDLNFTHYIDKASADLMKACAKGTHIGEGLLTVRKAGGDNPLDYLKIKLTDVIVTSVQTGGSGGEDRLTENVTLNFAKFKYEYKVQTAQGGAGASPNFGWDIPANKEA